MKRHLLPALCFLLLIPSARAILDTNENGLSDLWEREYNDDELFDETFLPGDNPDKDRWTNAEEAAAGTDPFNPNPPDGIVQPTTTHTPAVYGEPDGEGNPTILTPEVVTVSWPTIAGKQYTILVSFDLSAQSWVPVEDAFIGTGTIVHYSFQTATAERQFWRVAVCDVDSDEDGLTDAEEAVLGTDPDSRDSDDDGIGDKPEVEGGTDPNDPDTDGDGVPDGEEIADGTDPKDSSSFKGRWHLAKREIVNYIRAHDGSIADDDVNGWGPAPSGTANWLSPETLDTSGWTAVATQAALGPAFAGWHPFPDLQTHLSIAPFSDAMLAEKMNLSAHCDTTPAGAIGPMEKFIATNLRQFSLVYELSAPAAEAVTIPRTFLLVHEYSDHEGNSLGPPDVETITCTWTVPEGETKSNAAVIEASFARDPDTAPSGPFVEVVKLLPMEVAPDVLAVNSDFDEGRIDPTTGYAIPDCDDIPDVDAKTGSGNTEIALNAARDHLDGLFANDEKVTDDLHQGWFGVNPHLLDDDFWDGATVTIRKLDKDDPDTGRKESGQVRFYAKWSDADYYGISPYDFVTLQPVNLVSAGVNKRPGEGVYGSTSTIPDDAEFWMEGIRPGKITLEWRLQKGDIDVKHEQTFLVETRLSPDEWKAGLAYKIRLDTDNDPSGQIDVNVDPRGAPREYWVRVERMSEYYDYYQENYLVDDDFQWCGLARLAGSQVISGVSDARFATLSPSAHTYRIVGEIIDAMSEGGYDIFDSLAWQHHAYRSSGLGALEWTNDNFQDQDLDELFSIQRAWHDFDDGINGGGVALIEEAAHKKTDYEQNTVIVATWNALRAITPVNNEVTNTFTILAENVMKPNGDRFTVAVPGGDLSNTADRWKWIDDTAAGSPNGIIGAWKAAGRAGQRALVSKTLRADSERFTQVPAALRATAGVFPGERSGMQVNDDLDTP